MITGFFAFVIWLLVLIFFIEYVFNKPNCKIQWKVLGLIVISGVTFSLLWLYNYHWDWLAIGMIIIFFIYLAIQGLFGPL